MLSAKLLTLLPIIIHAQLYYPDEATGGIIQYLGAATPTEIPKNLTRGSRDYEQYVDSIIAKGILKLTLAIDRVMTTSRVGTDFDNIVYAPVSIAASLALILLGSNGRTFDELTTIMGLASGVADIENKSQIVHQQFGRMLQHLQATSGFQIGTQVNFGTAIFVQNNYPIRSVYKDLAESLYESEILNMDFVDNSLSAQKTINAWVADRTMGKITNIINEAPPPSTKVIVVSAMYFKAEWEKPFFEGVTRQRPFYTNGRRSKSDIMVEMMSNGGTFPYYKDSILNCEIMGFPYKNNQTTMYVIMPNDSSKDRLKQLELQLNSDELERLVNNVQYTAAVLLFPKMKIESTIDLKDSLQKLGVKSLFNPATANLALLSPGIVPEVAYNINRETSLYNEVVKNPISALSTSSSSSSRNGDDSILIFSRIGDVVNCTEALNTNSSVNTCQEVSEKRALTTSRIGGVPSSESIDDVRQRLNQLPGGIGGAKGPQNPGLYADQVIHKVYMDITESGTEAAAATSVSLSRDGGRVTFRVDVPFFFFIRHEQTKTVLFWGSVNTPTPYFKSGLK